MRGRLALLFVIVALVFGVTAAILLKVLPAPLGDVDYLVIGAIATFIAMLALFFILIKGGAKMPDVFYKRRIRNSEPGDGEPAAGDSAESSPERGSSGGD